MSVATPGPSSMLTEHALLVSFGQFAAQIGLLEALKRVPFPMKTVAQSPGDTLTELLVHILAGGMHVKELDASPHPLVQDRAVAQAWGQAAFPSASGVSDLLRAAALLTGFGQSPGDLDLLGCLWLRGVQRTGCTAWPCPVQRCRATTRPAPATMLVNRRGWRSR